MMVAYIDEFKDRFRVGPIRRVPAASLDCGFITPRGYRMFRSRPVSRMAARHEAPARGILEIHADSFMAVYGYRKTHAQLLVNICSFQGHCYCRRRPIALFDDYCGSRPPLLRIKATGC